MFHFSAASFAVIYANIFHRPSEIIIFQNWNKSNTNLKNIKFKGDTFLAKRLPLGCFLCLSYEFFLTFGAGDGDFAFAPGNPYLLAAAGAVKVAVLPVPKPLQKHQVFSVFPIALIGIPGERPEYRPNQKPVGKGG